jgi:uncharacterized protein
MDVAALHAIDMHTHVHGSVNAPPVSAEGNEPLAAMAKYFKTDATAFNTDELAVYYRERNMAAVTFMVDVKGQSVEPSRVTNEEIAERAHANADVLIPFASIDPARGAEGVRMAKRLIEDYGVKGFKFHPSAQAFYPNDRSVYPLYEVIEAAGVPALFHTGQTGAGAGTRGGGGIRLAYSNPMYTDDVAVDFPDLPIILAHPSFPGRRKRSASRRTSRRSTSTCQGGRRSTSRPSWCSTRTRCSSTRCCSAPTFPCSHRNGG